ncbi:MAG: hypothetical protein EAY75_11990 [Bacteroidetes bacterium]|nr:MAG: hypothetical protein EAY75_11990 [Bacteroidota bacterium]
MPFIFRLLSTARFIFTFIAQQKKLNAQFLPTYLAGFSHLPPGYIAADLRKKIELYYCLGIPLTCAVYNQLYHPQLTPTERQNAVLAAIATPLIDDFTDQKIMNTEQISQLILNPQNFTATTMPQAIVKDVLLHLTAHTTQPQQALQALNFALEAQLASQKQADANTPPSALLQLSLQKGAWSHVVFHHLITTAPSPQLTILLQHMGGLLQLSNDFFDVYKDHQEGIFTIANTCTNYTELINYYQQECKQFCLQARRLPYPKPQLERFVLFMSLIMARGIVALRQFQKLQHAQGGGLLQYAQLSRQQLIVDMEKPINIWRTATACYQITKS